MKKPNFKALLAQANMLSSAEGNNVREFSQEISEILGGSGDMLFAEGDDLLFAAGSGLNGGQPVTIDNNDKIYQLTFTNALGTDELMYLCPSFLAPATANGNPLSGKAVSGNTVTASGGFPTSITQFYGSLATQPLLVKRIKYSSTVSTQLDTYVTSSRYNDVFTQAASNAPISVGAFRDQYAQNDKIIDFPLNLVFDNYTQTTITVKATSTLTVTLTCGAVVNTGDMLQNRVNKVVGMQKPKPINAEKSALLARLRMLNAQRGKRY